MFGLLAWSTGANSPFCYNMFCLRHQKRPAGVGLVFFVYILGMVERKLTNNRGAGQLSLPGMSMKKLCDSK